RRRGEAVYPGGRPRYNPRTRAGKSSPAKERAAGKCSGVGLSWAEDGVPTLPGAVRWQGGKSLWDKDLTGLPATLPHGSRPPPVGKSLGRPPAMEVRTMPLSGQQFQALHAALLGAFDEAGLQRLVAFGLGENLNAITSPGSLSDVIFQLIRWAQ